MNADAKKAVLRMIPYGIYVLTADDGKGNVAAATVNWVTQTAFAPPLVVVGVKTDSGAYAAVKSAGTFALNMLGKEHKGLAFTFFKPASVADGKISSVGKLKLVTPETALKRGDDGLFRGADGSLSADDTARVGYLGTKRPPGEQRPTVQVPHLAPRRRGFIRQSRPARVQE